MFHRIMAGEDIDLGGYVVRGQRYGA
jgi:hypothetical protein